ncbi:MAG: helix-turn-helix domain-containing protein [Coriobacteriia bacterium]|nr:helix-turn-helix domain-containing protein [Coriobacteriia bacterium]
MPEKLRSETARRFQELREESGLGRSEVARRLGVTPQTIWKLENSDWNPTGRKMEEFALKLGWPLPRLAGIEPGAFPLIGRVAAGQPLEAIPVEDERHFAPPSITKRVHSDSFFLRVSGDSVDRIFPDGMIVLVDPHAVVKNNDVAVVNVNGYDATLKRIFFVGNSVVLHPESHNPEHRDLVFDDRSDDLSAFRIIGKVEWATYPERARF